MANKVVQLNRIGTVTFSKNRRSKNIKISVKPDKSVLVSYPFYVSNSEALNFVQNNKNWISEQQQKFSQKKTQFSEGSIIDTKLHKIIFYRAEKNHVKKEGKTISVFITDFKNSESEKLIDYVITEVYRIEAKVILPAKLHELALLYNFDYGKVTIRNNKRNWGSCSSKNNISLNLQMMKLPDVLIEYILLHELVHTKVKNHGPKFWELLNQVTNQRAKILAKQVKQYSTYTL